MTLTFTLQPYMFCVGGYVLGVVSTVVFFILWGVRVIRKVREAEPVDG